MKKLVAGLIAVATIASVAVAEEVFSKNAVGFINIDVTEEDVTAGTMYALSVPFLNMNATDGSWNFKDLDLATAAPAGSYVYFWGGADGWSQVQKRAAAGKEWSNGNHVLKPGELFFFKPTTAMTIVMSGEVPADDEIDVEVEAGKNLSAIANPYPTELPFADSALSINAQSGSYVYFWDTAAGWKQVQKRGAVGTKFNTSEKVKPGTGFFFKGTDKSEETSWTVEKEYSFP